MMISQLLNLNWLSISAAFFAFFMLGYIWYQLLFVKSYKLSLGKEGQTLPNKPIFIIGPAICSLAYVITTAVLMHALHLTSYGQAVELSLIMGLGYLVSNTVNIAINPNIPRPLLYALISGSYFLVAITLASLILVAMK